VVHQWRLSHKFDSTWPDANDRGDLVGRSEGFCLKHFTVAGLHQLDIALEKKV